MELRGAAPASVCPRCGAEQPPTDEPLAHCATCKLAYDPKAEHVERPRRGTEELALEKAPRGVTITREPGEYTVRWALHRMTGVGALLLGVVCTAFFLGNLETPGESLRDMILLGAAAVVMVYLGLSVAFGEWVLRVDERQLYLRREPLRLTRGTWIGRNEIDYIALREPGGTRDTTWVLAAVTPRGELPLGTFQYSELPQARCIKQTIEDALRLIEPA